MRKIRKIGFFSLLVLATLFVQNASALLILPDSTYAKAVGNWQGNKDDPEGGDDFEVLIEFTVYNTAFLDPDGNPDESDLVDTLRNELGLTGPYIYVYQIFNSTTADKDIGSLAVFNKILGVSLDVNSANIGSQEDSASGIEPRDAHLTLDNSETLEVVWEFEEGIWPPGGHSYFLVIGSDAPPVVGDFRIEGPKEGEFPVPEPGTPEPATVALLGIGSVLMLTKRRKSVQ